MSNCTIPQCELTAHGHGWCRSHYMNWWRHGDPTSRPPRKVIVRSIPLSERFWSKVDFSHPNGCWLWTGSRRHEYGEVFVDGVKHYAHRAAYWLIHGDMPSVVRHACDTPLCVRPDHLIAGTQAENIADMAKRGRWRNQFSAGPNNDPDAWPFHQRRSSTGTA